jgi:hypothetical protein
MSDLGEHPERSAMFSAVFEFIKLLIDGVVAEISARHHDAGTQEHQFTSRLAEAIESRLHGITVNGVRLRVTVQELSDRGPASRERRVGADLYISVGVDGPDGQISKGLLVQAKWASTIQKDDRLKDQCRQMLERTEESYVWVYAPRGVAVIRATDIGGTPLPKNAGTIGTLIADGLRCSAGDPRIGLNMSMPVVDALNSIMRDLSAERGISFVVTPAS